MATADTLREAVTVLRGRPGPVDRALADLLQVLSWFPSFADPTDLLAAERVARAVLEEEEEQHGDPA